LSHSLFPLNLVLMLFSVFLFCTFFLHSQTTLIIQFLILSFHVFPLVLLRIIMPITWIFLSLLFIKVHISVVYGSISLKYAF
jgi:hypothetical protein